MSLKVKSVQLIFIAIILMTLASVSCKNEKTQSSQERVIDTIGIARIKFDTTFCDFGDLIQGEKATYTFKFKNIGTADLVIYDAYSSCGCTVPNYSKEPISPGETGKIEVLFNSEGKRGVQYKTVVLKLNTKYPERSLNIKANVIVK